MIQMIKGEEDHIPRRKVETRFFHKLITLSWDKSYEKQLK